MISGEKILKTEQYLRHISGGAGVAEDRNMPNRIVRFFHFTEHGTNLRREIIGGVTTFMTMSYIVVVNPAILNS